MPLRRSLKLVCFVLLAGCSGGGSSGFDLSPESENRQIALALDERRCVEEDDLSICPAGQPFASVPAIPNDIQPAAEEIQLTIAGSPIDITGCAAGSCVVHVQLTTAGIPATASYQLAAREQASDRWTIGRSVDSAGLGTGIEVALPDSAAEAALQLAVLVYLEHEPIAPGTIATLHESGAELVFVD